MLNFKLNFYFSFLFSYVIHMAKISNFPFLFLCFCFCELHAYNNCYWKNLKRLWCRKIVIVLLRNRQGFLNINFCVFCFFQGLLYSPNHWLCLDQLITVLYVVGDYTGVQNLCVRIKCNISHIVIFFIFIVYFGSPSMSWDDQ